MKNIEDYKMENWWFALLLTTNNLVYFRNARRGVISISAMPMRYLHFHHAMNNTTNSSNCIDFLFIIQKKDWELGTNQLVNYIVIIKS